MSEIELFNKLYQNVIGNVFGSLSRVDQSPGILENAHQTFCREAVKLFNLVCKFRFYIGRFVFQHEQASEDASTILGDKLQQKMDSVTFAQERMKRQLKDLQEKVQGTPADVTDVKDRIEVWNYIPVFSRGISKHGGYNKIWQLNGRSVKKQCTYPPRRMWSARYTSYRGEAAKVTRAERVTRVAAEAVGAVKTWTTLRGISTPYWERAPGELSVSPVW